MSCFEFRQEIGADPESRTPGLAEHRLHCRPCAAFLRQQQAFSQQLAHAFAVEVPESLPARIQWRAFNQPRGRTAWMALAASVVAALTLSVMVWLGDKQGPLPNAVIAHVLEEVAIMEPGLPVVGPQQVSAVLAYSNVRLDSPLRDDVTHAGLCPFRGELVPHLVLEVDGHTVSVLMLPDRSVDQPMRIEESGFSGIVIPTETGSMAVVADRSDLLTPVMEELRQKARWGI
ncbi:MAG: DUF3379 family protein [Gammaproteobacteria bacterium]|nr:DUF3379 family protein [Gammaproteobacteria bacterium]